MDGPSFHDERFVRDVAREIAREVARDSHEAEDLAQEAWLRSLTHPPRHWAFPKAWMRQVARRIAIKRHRSEDARREREVRHVGRAGEPEAPELLAKLEVARELRQALRALDPLDRRILLLRYVEDEPPRRIAKALGMPVETVRSRIKRALPKLRERLQRGGQGESTWLSSLLLVFTPRTRWSTLWVPVGASAVLLVAALGPWAARPHAPELEQIAGGRAAAPAAAESSARRAAAEEALEPAAEEPARAEGSLRVALRWRDDGSPARDLRVRVEPLDASGTQVGLALGGPAALEARSGVDGELALALQPGAWRVVPALGPARSVRVASGERVDLELRLPRGLVLAGRVRLPDGTGAAGAAVWLSSPERPQECEVVARADADGRFELASVDRASWIGASLEGWQDTLHHALRDPAFVADDGSLAVELALLADPRHLVGRVVDESGAPVAGAEVEVQLDEEPDEKPHERRTCLRLPAPVRTDEDGRYALSGLHRSRYALVAHAAGFAPSVARVAAFAKRPEDAQQALILVRPGRALAGRLTLPDGRPAVGARVELGLDRWFRTRSVATDARGEFRFEHLPGCRLEPRATLGSAGDALVGAQTFFRRGEHDLRWDAVLDEGATLAGLALDGDGAALAGWRVRARVAGAESEPARETVTDAEGRFAFGGCDRRARRLELFAPDAELPCGTLEEARAAAPLVLRPEEWPAAVGGWLVGGERGASLWLVREDEPDVRRELALDAHDGSFRASGLLPGPWRLELWEHERWSRRLARWELVRGEVRELGLVVAGEDGALSLRLPFELPPGDVLLAESGARGRVLVRGARPDEAGRIEWSLPPGEYELRLGGTRAARLALPFVLESGVRLELEPDFGPLHALELELRAASPAEAGRECWLEVRDERDAARIERALELGVGAFRVPLELPPGRYVLRVWGGGQRVLERVLEVPNATTAGPFVLASTQLPR